MSPLHRPLHLQGTVGGSLPAGLEAEDVTSGSDGYWYTDTYMAVCTLVKNQAEDIVEFVTYHQ
jgi:hypothetical protein